ncbi:MAG: mechanosensitive ion channel [Pseudomonadota bacterium]
MQSIIETIQRQFETYGPKVFAAIVILVGFILAAYIVRWLIGAAINRTGLAKKANETSPPGSKSLGASLSSAAFWVIVLVGVVQALTRLELTTVTEPLNNMLNQIFEYLPNILGAVLIFAIFIIVANVLRQTLKAVLVFADPLPEQFGLTTGPANVSGITATIASSIIMIVGGIAAFDALGIEAISAPATSMLNEILSMIPNIAVAALILTIFVIIARFVATLVRRTLPGTGVDEAVAELGILKGADSGLSATSIISNLSMFFIVLLGLIASLRALELETLTSAMNTVLEMGANIAFGGVIIFAGVFIARLVTGAMASAGSGATDIAANAVKWLIIILSVILGVSRMGLDPTGGVFILDAARILLIGGAAGLAIAFGWGGKDWAAKQLESWRSTQ